MAREELRRYVDENYVTYLVNPRFIVAGVLNRTGPYKRWQMTLSLATGDRIVLADPDADRLISRVRYGEASTGAPAQAGG